MKKPKGFESKDGLNSPRARAAWSVLKIYHPYRYAAYRPWASTLLKKYKNLNGSKLVSVAQSEDIHQSTEEYARLNDPWGQLYRLIAQRLIVAALDVLPATPYAFNVGMAAEVLKRLLLEEGELHVDHPAQRTFGSFAADEVKFYAHWACHTLSNRAVFDFTPELTNMFTRSNIGDAVLDQIHMPCESVYLHFGLQTAFPLRGRLFRSTRSFVGMVDAAKAQGDLHKGLFWWGEPPFLSQPGWDNLQHYLEGAYVSRNPLEPDGSLQIILIGRPLDSELLPPPQNFIDVRDESIDYHLPNLTPGITVQAALDQERAHIDAGQRAQFHRSFEHVKAASGNFFKDKDERESLIEFGRESSRVGEEDFDRALNVVLNALLYITSYPEEVEAEYPAATPSELSSLIEKTQQAGLPAKAVTRYQSELEDLGYVKIKFCGRHITKKAQELATRNAASGRTKTFKGRIGTWRWLDASKGHFKTSRNVWVRPSPDPTGTKPLTIYSVE